MMKDFPTALALAVLCTISCNQPSRKCTVNADEKFSAFESKFLDQYWKRYPSSSILVGYGKYYDHLVVPDSASFAGNMAFFTRWADSLNALDFNGLHERKIKNPQ